MKKKFIAFLVKLDEYLKERAWAHRIRGSIEAFYISYFGWFRGNAPLRIVGDSIAASLLILNDRFGACENQGIPGEKTEGMLFRFNLALKGKPKKIACSIGGNDLRANVPISDIVNRIFQMAERAKMAGCAFGWIEPPAVGPMFVELNDSVPILISAVLAENVRRAAKGLATLAWIPVRTASLGSNGWIKEAYMGDGIHPNFVCLGEVYFPAINEFFQR